MRRLIDKFHIFFAGRLLKQSRRLRRKAAKLNRRSGECIRFAERHYRKAGVVRFGKR